jgi:hypothetical protein
MSDRASEKNEILFIFISYVSWFAAPEVAVSNSPSRP